MKYLIILTLLMTGCSLITIKSETPPPKHRPEIVTVSAFDCSLGNDCKETVDFRFARSQVITYSEYKGKCFLILRDGQEPNRLNMTCNELDDALNQ